MTSFADMGLRPHTLAAFAALEIAAPVPVQAEAIPPLIAAYATAWSRNVWAVRPGL